MAPKFNSSFYFSAKKENSKNAVYFVTLNIVTPLCTSWGGCVESGILMQISTTLGNWQY